MAESQTVTTLRNKRDAIAAAIANYERQLDQARHDFTHVTAALAIFEAQDEPGSQRAYVALYRHFKYGEIATLCRAALEAGPHRAAVTCRTGKAGISSTAMDDDQRQRQNLVVAIAAILLVALSIWALVAFKKSNATMDCYAANHRNCDPVSQ